MTVQKCCFTLGWDNIGWDNIFPDVQSLGTDLSPVGEHVISLQEKSRDLDLSLKYEKVLSTVAEKPIPDVIYLWRQRTLTQNNLEK